MTGFQLLSLPITTKSTLQLKPPHSCLTPVRTHNSGLNPFVSSDLSPWIISRPGWPEQLTRHGLHWSGQPTTWPSFMMFTGTKPQDTALATKCGLALRTSERLARQKKLDYKWLGPYTIDWVISRYAYRLKLPTSFGQVHPIFSVTLLCPYDDDPITECQERHPPLLPPVVHDGVEEYEVEKILDSQIFHGKVKY